MVEDTRKVIAAMNEMEGVQMALRVLRRVTGMRIALIARVEESTWTACVVLDEANFGIKAGDQLELHTTY